MREDDISYLCEVFMIQYGGPSTVPTYQTPSFRLDSWGIQGDKAMFRRGV